MTVASTPTLRWSSVRDCPRKAVYEATGVDGRERTDREQRILFRGRRIGRDYADFLRAANPSIEIELERKVVWPLGVGHIDIYLPETRTAVEVLSSAFASDSMVTSKLLQLVGYIEHDPDADNGALVIIDPSDFTEDRVILHRDSPVYRELVEEMEARIGQVLAWRDTGTMPSRVCAKPGDARSHFCLYPETCFDGWTPEPLPEIDTPDARAIALQFSQAKQREKEAEAILTIAKEQRLAAQEKIVELDPPVGTVKVGPFELKRIHYTGRRTFNLTLAENDSRLPDELLNEFVKVGDPYDVFQIKRVDTGPAIDADQDEEVPF